MWLSSPSPKYGLHVRGPLVRFGEEQAARVARVHLGAQALEDGVRFRQVFAGRAFALDEIGHGVEAHAVDPHVEPEAHHLDDPPDNPWVVEVEIGLVRKEAMPVVLLGNLIPGPVRMLRVAENDAHAGIAVGRIAPHVVVAFARVPRGAPRRVEPGVLVRGVIDDQFGDDFQPPGVCLAQERPEITHRAVRGMDPLVVRDVVAIVFERRGIERQQPDRRDTQARDVIELARETGEVADAVVVAVEEGPNMDLIEDCVLVPEGIIARGVVHSTSLHAAERFRQAGPCEMGSGRFSVTTYSEGELAQRRCRN